MNKKGIYSFYMEHYRFYFSFFILNIIIEYIKYNY